MTMDTRFLPHNSHLEDSQRFIELDPDLRLLQKQPFIYHNKELDQLPLEKPGIYTVCGGHKVGKTIFLKNWIQKLLENHVSEKVIAYFSGKMIKDYHDLKNLFQKQLDIMPQNQILYLMIDDINHINDWKKAITYFVDKGSLTQVALILSSSSSTSLSDINDDFIEPHSARQKSKRIHLYPLSFRETVILKRPQEIDDNLLFKEFNQYLLHGGYLHVINEIQTTGSIDENTLKNYGAWLRDETIRQGKHENFLREIISTILNYSNDQVTWNSLAQELTIDHPKTIGDYFAFLESLDIVFVQYALLEKELKAAPKKARKLMFIDPFIFHAMQAWLQSGKNNNLFEHIKLTLDNPLLISKLVESCVISEVRKYFPTYYIKAEGEVDLAYIHDEAFWPIEITWSTQIRAKDLKQILKYPNGRILTKTERSGVIEHIRTEPLPLALWQLGEIQLP